jgi:tensin
MDDGCFIVRDSQTVSGGYALTIKVSVELMRQRKKIADDIEITADMCVTHFLIQPDPEGVKLQGWDEPAFKTLPDFIAKHTMEKLCLPCILKLPKDSSHHQVKKKDQVQLISAAACDLILLGSIEVLHSMGEGPISEAARQLKALGLHSATVVNFKASVNGLTITDNSNGILTKRNYPINCITFCGLGPNDIRWNLSHLGIPASKSCFGIIHKMLDAPGYLCLLFTQFDPSQPVLNIVSFVKKLINQSKLH